MNLGLGNKKKNHAAMDTQQSAQPLVEFLEGRQLLSGVVATIVSPLASGPFIAGAHLHGRIGVNVANDNTTRLTDTAQFTIYASLDDVVADGYQITTRPQAINIAAGRNRTFWMTFNAYPNNLNGSYYILGQITGANVGTVEAVSQTTVGIEQKTIDLATTILMAPINGRVNSHINVTVEVANNGNSVAKGILAMAFAFSANTDGSSAFQLGALNRNINIHPGKMTRLHYAIPIPPGSPTGNQYLVATADPNNVFLDSNLTNNTNVLQKAISIT